MHNIKLVNVFLTVMMIIPAVGLSQIRTDIIEDRNQGMSPDAKKQIDPEIQLWYLKDYGAFIDSIRLDTLQDYFHLYHPVFKDVITASYLGNYGTPYLNNNFFKREPETDFFFLKSREAYFLTPQKIKYYNTRTPYTLLDFSQSEHRTRKNETRFNILHTQNINPYLNFVFRFDQGKSAGQYKNQGTNNNFVTLYSNYNKDELRIHGGIISNSIKNNENGGLTDDNLIFDDTDTDFLNVNLTSTRSELSNTYFFATGEYRLGKYIETETISEDTEEETEPESEFKPIVGIMYSFEYQNHAKEFFDEKDTTNTFFPNTYYGHDYIKDSVRFRMIKNIIQLKQYEDPNRKTSFGKRAFIGHELVKASSPGYYPGVSHRNTKNYSNVFAGGGIFRQKGRFWNWNAGGRVFILGRNAGQTELSGTISKPLPFLGDSLSSLRIKGNIRNMVPDFFQEKYYSNHIKWNNNLKMEQRMTAQGSLLFPVRNLELSANYAVINNFIYNDTLGIPTQDEGQLLVLSAFADKDFNFRNLHFRTRLLWQKSSDGNILHLPEFSTFVSAYFKFVVSKVLFTQIGFDLRYYTPYYADEYDPATGLFHLQDDIKLGDFPYLDAYVSMRLKRTRIFLKMINVGTEFINKPYFTTPHYPMNRRTFRLGVSWAFYD